MQQGKENNDKTKQNYNKTHNNNKTLPGHLSSCLRNWLLTLLQDRKLNDVEEHS